MTTFNAIQIPSTLTTRPNRWPFVSRNSSLRFFSDYLNSGQGFELKYESSNVTQWSYNSGECGGNLSTPYGTLTSPSYPGNYSNDADCTYTISQPTGTVILLNFISMDIEHHVACDYDYLEIRDGPSADSPLLDKLCGVQIPAPIKSSQNQLWMK